MTSKIEWTNITWNPVTGCTKISEWCRNCYAERLAWRLKSMGVAKYSNGFKLALHPDVLELPKKTRKPSLIFVNSMSDLFHKDVPFDFIEKIFDVMNAEKRHIFQVLTKRPERLLELAPKLKWGENIWMGVTVENGDTVDRIEFLRKTGAKVKFISAEPLIGDLWDADFTGIDWVIVGGESGPWARPMKESWVRNIQKICRIQKVPFFFKQWWGVNKKKMGRLLDGKTYDEYPEALHEWIKK